MNVKEYIKENGQNPFRKWLKKLDRSFQLRIRARIARIETTGNLGDSKKIQGASNLYELRFTIGPAFRVYYGIDGDELIILLVGGDKSTQTKDIEKAKSFWEDYNA